MDFLRAVTEAYSRISPYLRKTPLEFSPYFSERTGAKVYLKLENQQVTGSFKARGALAKLTLLGDDERRLGVVTASSGNHGAAVAYGMQTLRIGGEIWVPENVSPAKLANIQGYLAGTDGEVRFHGTDSGHTELFARRRADDTGRTYVSPYNDADVVAGQGTLGIEILEQLGGAPDAILASVGGGGLLAGTAGFLRAKGAAVRVIASSPAASCAMATALQRGHIGSVTSAATLSDGTAGDIEPGCVTYPWCRALIDAFPLVEEPEIAEAMRAAMEKHHVLVEGAAGVALASLDHVRSELRGKTAVVILCGANLSLATLKSVL